MDTPTSSISPTENETPSRKPIAEGTPILCMSEDNNNNNNNNNTTAVWSYNGQGKPGAFRLISVEKLLAINNNPASIDLYEWEQSLLSWPRNGSVLVDNFNDPPGMPPYAAISHTWRQTDEVLRRSKEAARPLWVEAGLETPHQISWLGLVQAATAAKSLFCEYLWLDLLCLDELSREDKKLQIANMKRIYSNARAVIVMVGGVSAAQPLDQTSDWINRAWTLQEATLCYETWVLVEWKLMGKISPRSEKHLEHKDLEGDIKIFRLRQLLSHQPGQVLGEAREHGVRSDEFENTGFLDVEVVINCFGTERLFSAALDAVVTAKEICNEAEETDSEESDKSSTHGCEPDPTDPYGEDLLPYKRIPGYFKDFQRPEIQYAAAWRSMWLRTSAREQDMVFSTAHLLGAQIEVNYKRQLNDLIHDVVKQVTVPAWLTIGDAIPVIPESGLIPMLPIFTAQGQPSYQIDNEIIPAASLVNGDYYCFDYDIEIKSLETAQGHVICARMFDVTQVTNLVQVPGKGKFAHSCDVRLSCSGLELYTICRFQGRMGSIMVIVGNGREWDIDDDRVFKFPQPYVYFLNRSETTGAWVKTGAGSITDNLFFEVEELERIPRGHLRVGGDQKFDATSCDCGKNSPPRCLPVCTYSSQEELDMALIKACSMGSQMKIQQLLDMGPNINATTEDNECALSNACARANLRIVELLIEHGANAETLGATSLQLAAWFGNHLIVQALIKMGANIHAPTSDENWLPLHHAVANGKFQSTRLLLEAGANANAMLGSWGGPLSLAARHGHLEIAQLLIRYGARIRGKKGTRTSPLIQAAFKKTIKIVKLLLDKGADVNARWVYNDDDNEENPVFPYALHAACQNAGIEVPKLLLEHGANPNAKGGRFGTALGVAAYYGNLPICELLIAHGADVNVKCGHWGTSLQAAGPHSYPEDSSRNEKVMLFLIDNGADIHVQGGRYGNALQAAAFGGKNQAVQVMIERGVDVNAFGGHYGSALQAAAHKGRRMTAKLLIDAGADTNVEPNYVKRLNRTLSIYVDMVRRLVDKGADVNASGGEYGNALNAACGNDFQELLALLQEGVESESDDDQCDDGKTSDDDQWEDVEESDDEEMSGNDVNQWEDVGEFHEEDISNDKGMSDDDDDQNLATVTSIPPEDQLAIVTILIEHGARIDTVAGRYGTALQAAAVYGNSDVVDFLLHHGAKVNAQGGRYWTALQAAARHGHYATVEKLIQAGAAVNHYGGRHGGALQAACVYGHEAVAKYLISVGAELKTPGEGWAEQWYRVMMGQYSNPLLAAAFHGSELIQPLLNIGADVNARDSQGRNAMHIAAGRGDCQLMEILLSLLHVSEKILEKDLLGRTYLHHAASSGCHAAVQLLLTAQANVDAVDNDAWTVLHWAARKGTVAVVQQLITAGVDGEARTLAAGWTALDMALFHQNLPAAALLADLATPDAPSHLSAVIEQASVDALGESIVGREHHKICNTCQLAIFGDRYACPKCRDFNLCFRCSGPLNKNHWEKYGKAHSAKQVS